MQGVKKISIDTSMDKAKFSGKRIASAVEAVGAENLNPNFGVISHKGLGTKEHKKFKGINLEEILED